MTFTWCPELIRVTILTCRAPQGHVWYGDLSREVRCVFPTSPFFLLVEWSIWRMQFVDCGLKGHMKDKEQKAWF